MNTTQTLTQMQELKLMGMAASYRSQLELPINQQLEGHELITHLLQAEKLHRGNERMEALLKAARFRFNVTPPDIECSVERNLTKQTWAALLECNYLRQGENILITGATGCGKSVVASALGYQACLMGFKTRYYNMNRLVEAILIAKTEDSYTKKSIIITSQLPVSAWHDYLEEPTLADALCDRLTARCHRIELKGES